MDQTERKEENKKKTKNKKRGRRWAGGQVPAGRIGRPATTAKKSRCISPFDSITDDLQHHQQQQQQQQEGS